jgi:hypothetical protein
MTFLQWFEHPDPVFVVEIVIHQVLLNTVSSIILPLESNSKGNLYEQTLDCIILTVEVN